MVITDIVITKER